MHISPPEHRGRTMGMVRCVNPDSNDRSIDAVRYVVMNNAQRGQGRRPNPFAPLRYCPLCVGAISVVLASAQAFLDN